MKILSIGNSFSQDAHKWLNKLAKVNGLDIETANLYIGGCNLETHWTNVVENNAYYDWELNGNSGERKISIDEALRLEKWDIVTLQQSSALSGLPESYEPYLANLADLVRKSQPQAKLYFYQTWAYEIDSDRDGFANYHNDQDEMYACIKETSEKVAVQIDTEIIPVGTIIQKLRKNVHEFDYKNGGISLCRDGFHLSYNYGRYTAAATWIATITGIQIKTTEFEDFDGTLLQKINAVICSHLNV